MKFASAVLVTDVVVEENETVEGVMAELINDLDTTVTLVAAVGGAGWPTLRFEGTPADLALVTARMNGGAPFDPRYLES